MRPLLAATMATVALVATACGTGAVESDSETDETGSSGESIQDFIPGAIAFDADAGPEDFRQQELEIQEQIAECMAQEGFEYVPYVPTAGIHYMDADSAEEFAEQYGFGISYDLLNQPTFEEGEVPPDLADDPNYQIREELSPEEQLAYDEALHGAPPDVDPETMSEEEIDEFFSNYQPEGCQSNAYEDAFGDQGASQAFYEEFGEAIEEMSEQAQSDPRIVALQEDWSACMAELGYDFADEQDANIFILRRLEEVGAISDLEIDPGGGYGYGSEGIEPGSATYQAVEEILEEEIEIAKAATECRGDVDEVFREVFAEYEQRFIEDNRAALERFRDEDS